MQNPVRIVIYCTIFIYCYGVKLPSYFSKCSLQDPNLGECIKTSGNAALPTLIQGDKNIHVMKLDPLFVPQMFIDVNGGLKINLTNCNILGLETARIEYSHWDVTTGHVVSHVVVDHTHLIGEYDVTGRILILPITGQGPCNITFVKPLFKFTYDFVTEERNNKKYMKITDQSLTYETERAYFKLENLFGGNPQLGQTMLTFLDENWKEVNQEIGGKVGDALALVFSNILQQIYNRVPFDELFEK